MGKTDFRNFFEKIFLRVLSKNTLAFMIAPREQRKGV